MTTLKLELTTEETERLASIAQNISAQIGDVVHKLTSQLPAVSETLTAGAQALAETTIPMCVAVLRLRLA